MISTPQEALEFVSAEITEQARQNGVELSEIERKMLYFSETAWTLSDRAEVNAQFDRDYDQAAYEAKIATLITSARARADVSRLQSWHDAIRVLSQQDYFVSTMLRQAIVRKRPPHDLLRLLLTGFAIVATLVASAFFFLR